MHCTVCCVRLRKINSITIKIKNDVKALKKKKKWTLDLTQTHHHVDKKQQNLEKPQRVNVATDSLRDKPTNCFPQCSGRSVMSCIHFFQQSEDKIFCDNVWYSS